VGSVVVASPRAQVPAEGPAEDCPQSVAVTDIDLVGLLSPKFLMSMRDRREAPTFWNCMPMSRSRDIELRVRRLGAVLVRGACTETAAALALAPGHIGRLTGAVSSPRELHRACLDGRSP